MHMKYMNIINPFMIHFNWLIENDKEKMKNGEMVFK